MKKLKRLFTLIELLVVVVIIALIASIMLPALQQSKEVAMSMHCSNNLRTFGFVNLLYSDDNDSYCVPSKIWNDTGDVSWYQLDSFRVYLYLPALQDISSIWEKQYYCSKTVKHAANIDSSFGMNSSGFAWNPGGTYYQSYYLLSVVDPELSMLFADSTIGVINHDDAANYFAAGENRYPKGIAYRHFNKANAAFFDGHCEKVDKKRGLNDIKLWFPE